MTLQSEQSEKLKFFYSYFENTREDILFPTLEQIYLNQVDSLSFDQLKNGCKKMTEYENFSKECYITYWNKETNQYTQVYDDNIDINNWKLTMVYENDYKIKEVFSETDLSDKPKLQDLVFLIIELNYSEVFLSLLTGQHDIRN